MDSKKDLVAQACSPSMTCPPEHWHHLRTTNPLESTFATVRLRTAKARGCVSRSSILAMVFKLSKNAERHWLKLRGSDRHGLHRR